MIAVDNVNTPETPHSEGDSGASNLRDVETDDDELQLHQSLDDEYMIQEKEEESDQYSGEELEGDSEFERFQDDDGPPAEKNIAYDDDGDCITDLKLRILELEGQNSIHEQYVASLEDENSQLNDQIAQLTAQSILDQQLISKLKQDRSDEDIKPAPNENEETSNDDDDDDNSRQKQPPLSSESDSSVDAGELQTTIEQLQRTVLFLVEEKSKLQITVEELEHQLVQEKGALRNTIESLDASNRKKPPLKSIRTKMSKKKQQLKQELRTSMAKKKQELRQEFVQSLQLIGAQQFLPPNIVNDKSTTAEKSLDSSKPRSSVSPSLQINKLFSSTKMIENKQEVPPPPEASVVAETPQTESEEPKNSKDGDNESTSENVDVVELQKLKLFPSRKKNEPTSQLASTPENTSSDPPLVIDENTNQYDMIRETMERKRQSQKGVAKLGISAATRRSTTKVYGTGKPINVEKYREKFKRQLQQQEAEDEASESNTDDLFQAPSQEDMERMKDHLDVWEIEGWSGDDII